MNRLTELNSFIALENVIPQNKLEKQLADWDFANVILLFRIAGFDRLDDLRIITNHELNILFPDVSQQALKCRIRAKMVEWRIKNAISTKHLEMSTSLASETLSRDSSPTEWIANQPLLPDFILDDFLMSKKGCKIKEYYYQNDPPRFNIKTRDLFVDSFVDYIQTNNVILKPENFKKLSEEIVKTFPGESCALYYVGGRVPKGKLYNKYKNNRHKMKSYQCSSSETDTSLPITKMVINEFTADTDYNKIKQILFSYTGHWTNELNENWEMTHLGRMAEIQKIKSQNIKDYIDEWPILEHSFAFKLIDIDFEKLYPGQKCNLINSWDSFVTKILLYTNNNYNDVKFKNILTNLSQDKVSRDTDIIMLLNTILKPTSNFKNIVTNKSWKPTWSEATTSICINIDDIKTLKTIVDVKMDHYKKHNSLLKPFIVAYDKDHDDGSQKSFAVIVGDSTYYISDDFVSCLDACFKLFFVFNIEFTIESKRVWLFIQKYFFNITSEFDWIDGGVQLLINELSR